MAKKINNPTKKKAWDAFSKMIRLRDCFATTSLSHTGKCITCGKNWSFKQLQAGHAIAGRRNALLFDEDLVHAQCIICNQHNHGEAKKYKVILIERHSQEWWDEKMATSKQVVQDKDMDFEGKAEEYTRRYKKIMESNGHYALLDRLKRQNTKC